MSFIALRIQSTPSSAWAQPGEQLTHLHNHQVVVGVERQRAILVVARPSKVIAYNRDSGEDAMDIGVVVVERNRAIEFGHHVFESCLRVLRPAVAVRLAQDAAAPGMRMGIISVERQGPVD